MAYNDMRSKKKNGEVQEEYQYSGYDRSYAEDQALGKELWNDQSQNQWQQPAGGGRYPAGSGGNYGNYGSGTQNGGSFSYADFSYADYVESEIVKNYANLVAQQMAAKPGAYQPQWQAQLNDLMNRILNREKFTYDLNADALYQQYKDQYTTQGKLAMMDTIGQAAAMTGGYGNSYAQSVGQQVYQGYLQGLNERVPELYQLALNKYNMDGDALNAQYAIVADRDAQDYARYRDTVTDWQTELARLQNQYNYEREFDYSKYTDGRDFSYNQYSDDRNLAYTQFSDDRAYNYQVERDKVLDAQWQAEFNEMVRQWQLQWDAQQAAAAAAAGGGGGGGGGSGGGSGGSLYNEVVTYLAGENAANTLGIIRTSGLSTSDQDKLVEEYYEPRLEAEVKAQDPRRDTSAYWSSQ